MQRNGKSTQTVNPTTQPINDATQSINGPAQPINGPAQPINGATQPINGPAQPINDAAQPINGPAQLINGATQSINDAAQPINGTARASVGRVRRQLGGYSQRARVSQRLLAAQVAISTVQGNDTLRTRMAAQGYDATRLAEGQALHAQALAQYQHERSVKSAPFAATAARQGMQAEAHVAYMRHVKLARVALRADLVTAQALGLTAARKRPTADWLLQAVQFYTVVLATPASAAALALYGVSAAELAATHDQVALVASAVVAQQSTQLAALRAAATRRTAMAALDAWMRDFMVVAGIALATTR